MVDDDGLTGEEYRDVVAAGRAAQFCHACYRATDPLVVVIVAEYGPLHVCADPYPCRLAATRAGIYGITAPMAWPVKTCDRCPSPATEIVTCWRGGAHEQCASCASATRAEALETLWREVGP